MRLSVLDQAPITKGNKAPDALQKAVELAIEAERLGYERIWMAEHHNTNSLRQLSSGNYLCLHCRKNEKDSGGNRGNDDHALFAIQGGGSI